MNNQFPYGGINPNNLPNFNGNNFQDMMIERLNNRVSRLERQIRILENRINNLNGGNPTFLKNNYDDNDNMYML